MESYTFFQTEDDIILDNGVYDSYVLIHYVTLGGSYITCTR